MSGDFCTHFRGVPLLPAIPCLFAVLPAHPLYHVPALFPLLCQHFTHPSHGLLLLQLPPVGKGFLLPHLVRDHAVNDVVGDLLNGCVTVAVKRVFINAVHAVQHIRDLLQLVRLGIHVAGEIALAEHLRHFLVHGVHRQAL